MSNRSSSASDRDCTSPRGLVSADGARVNRRIFSSSDIYQRELREIFGRCWLLLGHDSQLPDVGSFFTTWMGEDPVIVVRGKDGRIHAHVNACAHRGATVCLEDAGRTNLFVCPYHAWSFTLDGKLAAVAKEAMLYRSCPLDKSSLRLESVAKLDTFRGLIFATFDSEAPPLLDYLANMVPFLDSFLNRHPDGIEFLGPPQKWRVPTNWKIYQDNFAGDEYHVSMTHGSSIEALKLDWDAYLENMIHCYTDNGHGFSAHFELPNGCATPYLPVEQPDLLSAETQAYFRSCLPEVEQRVGALHSRCQVIASTVFPTFSMLPVFNTIRIVHPKGPQSIEIWSYCYVDRAAPVSVKREIARYYHISFGPAGIIEQDDSAVWESIATTSRGFRGQQSDAHFNMGLTDERWHEGLGCMITERLSEAAMRNFYRHWAALMGELE